MWRHYVLYKTNLEGVLASAGGGMEHACSCVAKRHAEEMRPGVTCVVAGTMLNIEAAIREFGRDVVTVVDASFDREVCVCARAA